MRKGAPQALLKGSRMLKSSRDEPILLINLTMSPSIWGPHHAFNVRIVDKSITVCGPRSQCTNTALLACKYSRRHGDLSCNSTALISSSMMRISSGLNVSHSFECTDTEIRFKGEPIRVVKCSSFATSQLLTSTSTKHGRANNARNTALVSGTKRVKGIPSRTSFRNCVSTSRWGKAASSWGQSESVLEYPTEKWNSRM